MRRLAQRLRRVKQIMERLAWDRCNPAEIERARDEARRTGKIPDGLSPRAREEAEYELMVHEFIVGTDGLHRCDGDRMVMVHTPLGNDICIHEEDLSRCLARGYVLIGPAQESQAASGPNRAT